MLEKIENAGTNFLHVALIGDANAKAFARLQNRFNFAGYPSTFFDDGYHCFFEAVNDSATFHDYINDCGSRSVPDLGLAVAVDWMGDANINVRLRLSKDVDPTQVPLTPGVPGGPIATGLSTSEEFTATTTDPDGDDLYYQWDWGNGQTSPWYGPYVSGEPVSRSYSYSETGDYDIRVRVFDRWQDTSAWSSPHSISVSCCVGGRGNVLLEPSCDYSDQTVDIADLTLLINHLFISFEAICCVQEADIAPAASPDGAVDIGDLTEMVNHLFITFQSLPSCE